MFNAELAGHSFTIDDHYKEARHYFQDYITSQPGSPLTVSEAEIDALQKFKPYLSRGFLETRLLNRKIAQLLVDKDVLLFHASAVMLDGKAYIFTAPSGTGKSTHRSLWQAHFGSRLTVINDDNPFLHITPIQVTAYGSIFGGKDNLQTNTSAEVAGIAILQQAQLNSIRLLPPKDAYPLLFRQVYRAVGQEKMIKVLNLVSYLCNIPIYQLSCNISDEAVDLCYRTLSTKKGRKFCNEA
ncbi:MAG: hypothetical protein J5974_02885 [Pyramidobacter sp.]|nr:hypothetical protein [Pyramidobacter sp.]